MEDEEKGGEAVDEEEGVKVGGEWESGGFLKIFKIVLITNF